MPLDVIPIKHIGCFSIVYNSSSEPCSIDYRLTSFQNYHSTRKDSHRTAPHHDGGDLGREEALVRAAAPPRREQCN